MAGIDKIYCETKEEALQLIEFLKEHRKRIFKKTGYKFPQEFFYGEGRFIFNFPQIIDVYLYKNCKLKFVQDRLKEQYGDSLKTMNYNIKNCSGEQARDIEYGQNIKIKWKSFKDIKEDIINS